MNDIKYLILDFGKVLFKPTTGHWFITPKFLELFDINKIDIDEFNNATKKFNNILDRKVITESEEYEMFYDFYDSVFKDINYTNYTKEDLSSLAFDMTYGKSKYTIYDDTIESLEKLSNKYKLLMLTDNWPCVLRIIEQYDIAKYFERVYVSSIYNCKKEDGIFFDYPINDYNIKKGEALYIDDSDKLLSIGEEKGLEVLLMDRDNKNPEVNHEIIHSLEELVSTKINRR